MNHTPYDPVERHRLLERWVSRTVNGHFERKYWRFRADRWYGGVATADCVGCGLSCRFCWANENSFYNSDSTGFYQSPQEVAARLGSTASAKGYNQARVSGGEPTISMPHLLQLLERLRYNKSLNFILETNGILLGNDRNFSRALSDFRFLHVRVSLKGCNEDDFEKLTGASSQGFEFQLQSLKNLVDDGVSCHAAVMTSFSSRDSFLQLANRLSSIDPRLARDLETEEVIMYPRVAKKLRAFGLRPCSEHRPDNVPERLV